MAGTNLFALQDDNLEVALTDPNGKVVLARCTGTPPISSDIYSPGALVIQTDAAPGAQSLFVNSGNTTIPSFEVVNDFSLAVFNDTGVDLVPGELVYINGLKSGLPTVNRTQGDQGLFATYVIRDAIANQGTGIAFGVSEITGLDTSGYTVNTLLYVDPTTPGGYTDTQPLSDPNAVVQFIGLVKVSDVSVGSIFFFPGNTFVLRWGARNIQHAPSGYVLTGNGAGFAPSWQAFPNPDGYTPIVNSTMTPMTKGQLVTIVGVDGSGNPTVDLVSAGSGLYANFVVTEAIAGGATGMGAQIAVVTGLNTNAYAPGTPLFLSPSSPGGYTSALTLTETSLTQVVGVVQTQDMVTGSIWFSIQIPSTWGLNNITPGVTAGQVLTANGTGVAPSWQAAGGGSTAITVFNATGMTIEKGKLVRLSSWNVGAEMVTIVRADALAMDPRFASHVATEDIGAGDSGTIDSGVITIVGFDTTGGGMSSVGDPVYLHSNGGFQVSTPAMGAGYIQQQVGTIKVKDASVGEIEFFVGSAQYQKIGTQNIQPGAVGGGQIANYAIGLDHLQQSISGNLGINAVQTTGMTLAAGTLFKIVGYTGGFPQMDKVSFSNGEVATHVNPFTSYSGMQGQFLPVGTVSMIDTSLIAPGTMLWGDENTNGQFSVTEPSAAGSTAQKVGVVISQNAMGSIFFFPGEMAIAKLGSRSLQDGSVGQSAIAVQAVPFNRLNAQIANTSAMYAHNATGTTLLKGELVRVVGIDGGSGFPTIDRQDVASGQVATHVMAADLTNGLDDIIFPNTQIQNLNTVAYAPGTPLYGKSGTPGAWQSTAPTGYNDVSQQIGVVKVQDVAAGVVEFYPGRMIVTAIGRIALQADSVSGGQINNYVVSRTKLDANLAGGVVALALQSSGGDFLRGTLLKIVGQSAGGLLVDKADASLGDVATHVAPYTMSNNSQTEVFPACEIISIDTSLWAPGTLLYLDPAVPGGYTSTMPVGSGSIAQEVAVVTTQDAMNGIALFYPGRMIIKAFGTENIQDGAISEDELASLSVATAKIQDNAVTPPKMNLVVSHISAPKIANDQAFLSTTALLDAHFYTPDNYPDTPRNFTITIAGAGVVTGNIRVNGVGADGIVIYEDIDISGGAGVYTGVKIFGNFTTFDTTGVTVLVGGETISVGSGNRIGLPSNIQTNFAIKNIYFNGVIPGVATYYSGVNTSGVDVSASTYDGVKQLIVLYNVGQ